MQTANYMSLIAFLFVNCFAFAGTVESFKVYSSLMDKEITNTIILPDSYQINQNNYPVVYLLHGAGDDHNGWYKQVPFLSELVDKYQCIVICPDGNRTSWYIDSPIDIKSKYSSYLNIELIDAAEKKFRIRKGEEHRAITGFSMGGHGALYSAFSFPEKWDYVASISGGVDLEPFPNNWDLPLRLGDYKSNIHNWKKYSVVNKVHSPKEDPFTLLIHCGKDDFFYGVNNKLEKILIKEKIKHKYVKLPGVHNWDFCRKVIEEQFAFFNICFN